MGTSKNDFSMYNVRSWVCRSHFFGRNLHTLATVPLFPLFNFPGW
jgi:hypothetical protein